MNWYELAQQQNKILYHATYRALWNIIRQQGLIPPVFLAQDYYQAEAFAEVPVNTAGEDKDIPDDWLDEIIVLKINVNDLNGDYLKIDPNLMVDNDKDRTFVYNSPIPPHQLEII